MHRNENVTNPKTELRDLLIMANLADPTRKGDEGQAALARALGASTVTVNRWLSDADERKDSLDPPRSVLLFLRAFVRLNERERAAVLG